MKKIPWTKYEVALLIDGYQQAKENPDRWKNIVEDLSELFREQAKISGMEVDETFRNYNGINLRMYEIKQLFEGTGGIKHTSALFISMVDLYVNRNEEYQAILKKARVKYSQKNIGKRAFDIDEAVILLDGYIKGMEKGESQAQIAEEVSYQLRKLATRKGVIFDESFRSPMGIAGRLRTIASIYNGVNISSATKVFKQVVELYKNDRIRYEKILKQAKAEEQEKILSDEIKESFEKYSVKDYSEEHGEVPHALLIDGVEYSTQKIEPFVLDSDIDGIHIQDLIVEIVPSGRGISPLKKWLSGQKWAIEFPSDKYVHRDTVFGLDEAANGMLSILNRQFKQFGGYTNLDTFFDAVSNELHMFLNDNDYNEKSIVYALAKHLFEKECYAGNHFWFFWERHIFQENPKYKVSDSGVLKTFIRSKGGVATKEECIEFLNKLNIGSGNINGLLNIGSKTDVFMLSESRYILSDTIGITENFVQQISKALQLLLDEVPFIIPNQLNNTWFALLPELPGGELWTPLLLQQIVEGYLKEYRTISALNGQSFSVVKAGIVSTNSIIETFPDLLHAVLTLEERVTFPCRFSAEELRQLIGKKGMVQNRELYYPEQLSKALRDHRFAWANQNASVLVLEK